MRKHPLKKKKKSYQTSFYLGYDDDLQHGYAFYCARYRDISFEEFLEIGIREFNMKLASIPESEPLYKIIKSRVINLNKLKIKEDRDYWAELKEVNRIPDIYLSNREIDDRFKNYMKNGGILNGKGLS